MVVLGWKHEVLGLILMDFEFGWNGFEWLLGFRFWADLLMILGGFKLVFDVSRYGELR